MNQRDKMTYLLGQLESLQYPIMPGEINHGYYDLIDCLILQYKSILKMVYPDFKDEE